MKIAIIGTTATSISGFRRDLIAVLVAQGHEVYALAVDYTSEDRECVRRLGATPVDFFLGRTALNPVADIIDTYRLSKILTRINPDVVLSYFSKPVIYGTLAAKLAGVPRRIGMLEGLGYTFTEQPYKLTFKTKFIRWMQVLLYRVSFTFLDRIIFLNHDDPVDLIEKYKIRVKNVDVLGAIGLNLDDYPYKPPVLNPLCFIFIGRLLAEKGIWEYVSAARTVKQIYPEVRFVVLGGLDEANPGGLTHQDLNVLTEENVVVYPGHVSNIVDWVSNSSVFVLPSYREGYPRSTQEAMAMGRAVITTDAPGCRETVEDGINGFLVPRWSSDKLAEKMIYFINNPELVHKMGLESYRIARCKYDANLTTRKMIELLVGSGDD